MFLLGFVGGVEGVLEGDEVFARFQGIEDGLLRFQLLLGLIGGFDRKAEQAVGLVDLDDAGGDFLAHLEDVLDFLDAIFADLRDVEQAIDVVLQANEGAEAGQLGDLAGEEVADLVKLVDVAPRVLGELFDPDRDALVGFVDFQHEGLDLFALFQHFGGMVDLARPGNVRDVDHAIQAFFQLDERAIAGEIANAAFDARPGRIFLEGLVPRVGLELADAEGNLLLFAVDTQDDGLDLLIRLEHVRGFGDALGPGKLGHVDQAFDARLQFHEGAVRDEVHDFALHPVADLKSGLDAFPRIGQLLLQSEAYALVFAVHVEHDHTEYLALLYNL